MKTNFSRHYSGRNLIDGCFSENYQAFFKEASYYLKSKNEASALVHDTYLDLLDSGFEPDPSKNLESYIKLRIRYVFLRKYLMVKRPLSLESIKIIGLTMKPEQRYCKREELIFILSHLRLDGISMSIAAQMFYGFSRKESAQLLQLSEACVRGRRYRIKKQLLQLKKIWEAM